MGKVAARARRAAAGNEPLTTALLVLAGENGNALLPAVWGGHHRLVTELLPQGVPATGKNTLPASLLSTFPLK